MKVRILLLLLPLVLGCTGHQSDSDNKEMLCGGYTQQRELSDDDLELFRKVMGETFTPLSVATQVVAGMNYCFRCADNCFVTIYQPLQGEPVISDIQYGND